MSENECKWKLYGYGSVAMDKPEGTNVIEVFLKDILYAAEGDVSKKTEHVQDLCYGLQKGLVSGASGGINCEIDGLR